ncbi:MAG: transaldolase family protein [Desulfobacterales bacterium]
MKAPQRLHEFGQSLWLDGISRGLLNSGTFKHYIDQWSVSGLTLNAHMFGDAIKNSSVYDAAIRRKLKEDKMGEDLLYDLMLEDLCHAADLLRPIHEQSDGVNGWVSLEVSPLLTYDAESTFDAAKDLYARARRPNIFIKMPGTNAGLPAVEEAIFAGIPVNVTLLFKHEQFLAAAEAFLRGIERRIAEGLGPDVASVATMFVSRWDAAVMDRVPDAPQSKLGVAVARRTYKAYCELLSSSRWQRTCNAGARPQRLLWAVTKAVVPGTPEDFYIKALAAPLTVTTMSECTLKALADGGEIGTVLPADGGDCEAVLARFAEAGIDVDALGAELQEQEAASEVTSWIDLMSAVASKSAALVQVQW